MRKSKPPNRLVRGGCVLGSKLPNAIRITIRITITTRTAERPPCVLSAHRGGARLPDPEAERSERFSGGGHPGLFRCVIVAHSAPGRRVQAERVRVLFGFRSGRSRTRSGRAGNAAPG